MALHIINQSPFNNPLNDIINLIEESDSVILLGDAVYLCVACQHNKEILNELKCKDIYALACDLEARGIKPLNTQINPIAYTGFVDLVAQHNSSISW